MSEIEKPKINENLPKIAIAGIATESCTFSPAVTKEKDFLVSRGDEIFEFLPFLSQGKLRKNAIWIPAIEARAMPGGIVRKNAFESFTKEILDILKKHVPFDGLFFDIHGAMSVQEMDDPEGDLIIRIRKVIGHKTIISTCMDLHGNVSLRLAKNTDIITCYRKAPHTDRLESKQRAVSNLVERIKTGKGKPKFKSWIPLPILLPGEKTSTRIEPGKSLYGLVAPAAKQEGIVDVGIWIGYAWADEPRNHAVVMVVGDDKVKVISTSENIAKQFWKVREDFVFVAPTASLEKCLEKALISEKKPFIISDMGDNPTAGGAGDVSWTLREILMRKEFKSENGPSLIYASIPGPELVEKAKVAGIGGKVDNVVGAVVDARYSPPIRLEGKVHSIIEGEKYAGIEVVVKIGSVFVIVTSGRKPYHTERDFSRLKLRPKKTDIIIVKIGYLTDELYKMRGDWMMALTPGGVDQDLQRLTYSRLNRPIFPFDKDMKEPNLKSRIVPLSDENIDEE